MTEVNLDALRAAAVIANDNARQLDLDGGSLFVSADEVISMCDELKALRLRLQR
jgi:hypothetical protein